MKEKDYQWADDTYNGSPHLNVKYHLSIWLKYMANVKKKKQPESKSWKDLHSKMICKNHL